jgi:proteic killer suppression protein
VEIQYKNTKLRKICTNADIARKKYGERMARKIHQRIDELSAADTVEEMIQFHIGRCHRLVGDREGQYALDLEQGNRLVFTIHNHVIQIAYIEEIVDYH